MKTKTENKNYKRGEIKNKKLEYKSKAKTKELFQFL